MILMHAFPSIKPHKNLAWRMVMMNAVGWILFAWVSNAAVTVNFEQSGNDLIVTSTGDLNLTGVDWSWSAWEMPDPHTLQIGANYPQDLVRLFRDSVSAFEFAVGADLFSMALSVLLADAYSGMTFGIWANDSMVSLYVPRGFRSGTIESSMTFRDLSLQSLGVIDQVIELGGSGDLRIIIASVPEPGSVAFFALTLVGMAFRRGLWGAGESVEVKVWKTWQGISRSE
jgi:hypothetical protein